MTKVKEQNWAQLDFIINNFFEIVEFKRGRGLYRNRVIFKRSKLLETEKDEFCDMDADPVKYLPASIREKLIYISKRVVSPEHMNVLCDFDADVDPAEWALETKKEFSQVQINNETTYKQLNEILESRYKLLGAKFLSKLYRHKEQQYFIATKMGLIPDGYAQEQTSDLR